MVEAYDNSMRSSIVAAGDGSKPLLSSRIPLQPQAV